MLYVDPGSGLLLWQVLGAGVLGLLFRARRVLARIILRKRD